MVKIEGLDNVLENLDNIYNEDNIHQAMGNACALIEASAKQKAPKDSGALRRSITSEVIGSGNDTIGTIFTALDYAPYVEYGTGLFAEKGGRKTPWRYEDAKGDWHTTSGQKPHPFMQPALDENRDKIIKLLSEGVIND